MMEDLNEYLEWYQTILDKVQELEEERIVKKNNVDQVLLWDDYFVPMEWVEWLKEHVKENPHTIVIYNY